MEYTTNGRLAFILAEFRFTFQSEDHRYTEVITWLSLLTYVCTEWEIHGIRLEWEQYLGNGRQATSP